MRDEVARFSDDSTKAGLAYKTESVAEIPKILKKKK